MLAALRFSIRLVTFRRLFVEDYLMLFSLLNLIALAALFQCFLEDIYTALILRNQPTIPDPDLTEKLISALRTDGIALILNTTGIWTIKLNFLSFFRRFGCQIRSYMVFWWISVILVIAGGIGQLGVVPWRCVFDITEHSSNCRSHYIYRVYEATIAIDVISDAISKFFRVQ